VTATLSVAKEVSQWFVKDGGYTQNTRNAWTSELQRNLSYWVKKGDIMQKLLEIFKQSIEDLNKDKQYWLDRLAEMNKISEELADELKDLTSAAEDLKSQIAASSGSGRYQPVVRPIMGARSEIQAKKTGIAAEIEKAKKEYWEATTAAAQKLGQPTRAIATVPRAFKDFSAAVSEFSKLTNETTVKDYKSISLSDLPTVSLRTESELAQYQNKLKQQSSIVQNIRAWILNTARAHDAKIANLQRDWPKIQEDMIRDFKIKVFRPIP
jgi:DNA repair exonuclease SbcCD ATPase subunit